MSLQRAMRPAMAAMLMAAASAVPLAAFAAAAVAGAQASDATVLDRYLAGLQTLSTEFTQTVSDPHGVVTGGGSGSLLVQRPGKFRWDYLPQDATADHGAAAANAQGQLLVADGKNLWFYDRELSQVTVKPLAAGLSSTPIMLLSGAIEQLRATFNITAAPAQNGLSWVEVKPRAEQSDFSDAQLGFRNDQLAQMRVHDRLGQTVQLNFSHSQRNTPLDPGAFEFKTPADVDVIGTPEP